VPAGAESVAVAADGRTLYVGGALALRAYRVAGTTLAPIAGPAGCIALRRTTGCALLAAGPFSGFDSLALSPDGTWLYGAGGAGFAFRITR
jgi:sugar lactone lactonase YvrE